MLAPCRDARAVATRHRYPGGAFGEIAFAVLRRGATQAAAARASRIRSGYEPPGEPDYPDNFGLSEENVRRPGAGIEPGPAGPADGVGAEGQRGTASISTPPSGTPFHDAGEP